MAAVSDDISDRDLRTKLKENGISCGPITPTTKNLYIRKLRKQLGEGEGASSRSKVPSRKSLSPKQAPRRALPSRRSVDPTPPPERKLIGFSSDEDEPAKEPVITRGKRTFGESKASPRKSSVSPRPIPVQNEERPVFRRRSYNTSSPKSKFRQDEERTDIDGRVNMDSHASETKRRKLPSYAGLRNLFLRKSMEDSKKYANETAPPPPPPEIKYDLEVEDETDRNVYQYTWLMWFLVGVLVAVFLLVYNWQFLSALLWSRMNSDRLKICGSTSLGSKNGACLTTDQLVEKLQYKLGTVLGLVKCGYSSKGGNITKDELTEWVNGQINRQQEKNGVFKANVVHTIKDYILQNPGCWLSCVDENGTVLTNKSQTFESIITSVALKPLTCRIREAFSRVFNQLLLLCGVITCSLCIYFVVKYRWMLRERRTRQMFELVDKILEVLKNHHNECQQKKDTRPYLAIPHVRDMLIKPSERESMKSAWDDAVKFLSAQESRVRVECQNIAGEEFEVWRLLHHTTPGSPSSPSGSNVKQGKVWQGTAFENFTTAVNPPLISPTPCLKIRNMFEPVMETRNQWHVFIQDAILEKCNEKEAAIVHISVDKASNEGCVYVKCADHRSSGAAFRAIHGCWFDGRLVTVKFLTLKRYHQRFPESINAKEHLKPSGMSSSTIPKLESAPVNESDSDSDS